ncbi:hypothetical protein [Undibacterium sp.]|uniref:hypothetical protein n=1 Tax=Undibacterium sp. TaxID=1914977 RepID=UPI00374D0EA6
MQDEILSTEKTSFRIAVMPTQGGDYKGMVFEKHSRDPGEREIRHECQRVYLFEEDALQDARTLRKILIAKMLV